MFSDKVIVVAVVLVNLVFVVIVVIAFAPVSIVADDDKIVHFRTAWKLNVAKTKVWILMLKKGTISAISSR